MITLNYRDARPIYEQVRDGLSRERAALPCAASARRTTDAALR